MYLDLGEDDKAVALIRERLTLAKSLHGAKSPEVAAILVDLGVAMHSSGCVLTPAQIDADPPNPQPNPPA